MTTLRCLLAGLVAVALLLPAQGRTATPDAPDRTHSGKVFASRNPDLAPAIGPNPAKVVVLVFADFQCPVCRRITDATHQIAEEFPGQVRIEYRQLPLAMHPNAEDAAVAALAAHLQGKFWEMHDLLFERQSALGGADLERYAQQIGLDVERWRQDVSDPALRARVRADVALAGAVGASATPTFLVNGVLTVGWASWNSFRYDVEQELKAAEALVATGTKVGDVHAARARQNLKSENAREAYRLAVVEPLAMAAGKD